jgi:hypothetical protein
MMNEYVEKDIDALIRNDKRTPKLLKQILGLVLLWLMLIMIIKSVICGLYVSDASGTLENL